MIAIDGWRHDDVAAVAMELRGLQDGSGQVPAELLEAIVTSRSAMIETSFDHLVQATRVALARGDATWHGELAFATGYALANCGRTDEAIRELESAVDQSGSSDEQARSLFLLADCHAREGTWEMAETLWRRAIEVARAGHLSTMIVRWQINRAAALIERSAQLSASGEHDESRRHADEAMYVIEEISPLVDEPRTPAYVRALHGIRHAQALRNRGDHERARITLDSLAWIDSMPDVDELSAVRCHLEASLALDEGDVEVALAYCRQGLMSTVSPELRHFTEPLLLVAMEASSRLGDHRRAASYAAEVADLRWVVVKLDKDQEALVEHCLGRLRVARGGADG